MRVCWPKKSFCSPEGNVAVQEPAKCLSLTSLSENAHYTCSFAVSDRTVNAFGLFATGMKRYETDVRDGVLFLETDDGWIEIGSLDGICELIGGETYVLEYDEQQRSVSWLDTDEEGKLSFDVRETLTKMSYDQEFVANIESVDADTMDGEYSMRASVFADLMTAIWEAKGDL